MLNDTKTSLFNVFFMIFWGYELVPLIVSQGRLIYTTAIIAIKRFSLLYNLDIKQIDLNLTYVQKKD